MDNDTASRLFAAAVSEIRPAMSFPQAMSTVAAAGLPYLGKANDWSAFQGDVLRKFQLLPPPAQMAALRIVASRLAAAPAVRLLFAEHGYEFLAGAFVPVAELDAREAQFLPPSSANELSLATKRLVDGDDSGAITKACGAVDLMTADLYVRYGLRDPAHAAFAAKVMTAAKRLQIFEKLESDIASLGLKPAERGACD